MMKPDCILLVDDRTENLFALENMLAEEGREFLKATNGNDALKIAFKEHVSLILLDVQMPEMDGFETAELLKSNEKTRKIPVIFVTAISKDAQFILKGLKGGAIDYLFKPLDVDITRAKVNTMLKIQRQQYELEEKNKELQMLNEEKNKLMGIAAHDLRNPANNILLMSDIVMELSEDKLDEESKEFMQMIRKTSEHMVKVVNNILHMSQIESDALPLKNRKVDLVELVKNNVKLNKFSAGRKNIEIVFNSDYDELLRETDPDLLEQVMNNLISNAIKFSHSNTTIEVSLLNEDDKTIISVKDEGQGIPAEEMKKLFKFFSKTSVQGTDGELSTGLGLAISQKIINTLSGTIKVESKEGKGSEFSIIF